jgi:epoxide hydrolase-like predicted phosphatase
MRVKSNGFYQGVEMGIQAVIWDLGGVLLRTEDYGPRRALAQRFGMTLAEIEAFVFSGESGDRAQRGEISVEQHWENQRKALGLSPAQMQTFRDAFWAGDRLDTDLVAYIRRLRLAYKTGLLSNAFSDLRQIVTETWKFVDAFDEMVISAEVGLVKPDPRIYHLVLQRLGVAPASAVFIDDFSHNIQGARAEGLNAIHFQNPQQARQELEILLDGSHP